MEQNPLISVVIPAYNRENTISYCLDSVVAQTYRNIEVIVADDLSTDKTVNVVKNYPDNRVSCIVLEKNSGAQAARNRGIIEAKGDWIAFQDSDDEWLPDKLEKQIAALANANYDPWFLVYSNVLLYNKKKGTRRIWQLPAINGANKYSVLLQSPAPLYQTILVSKVALEKINYLDENVPSFQEWDTSIRLAKYCKFFHIDEPLMIYHIGDHHAISGNNVRHVEGWNYIINKFEDDIKIYCGEEVWHGLNIELLNRCLNFGLLYYYDKYRRNLYFSDKHINKMRYLIFCRKFHIRANNVLFRVVRKIYRYL